MARLILVDVIQTLAYFYRLGNGSRSEGWCDLPNPDPEAAAVYVLAGGFTGAVFV